MFPVERFETGSDLAEVAVARLGEDARGGIDRRDKASLALAGGSTPHDIYQRLSRKPLQWSKVTFTLTDERWVSAESNRSNARFYEITSSGTKLRVPASYR